MPEDTARDGDDQPVLSFSLCDPDAVLTPEKREARNEALRRLSEALRRLSEARRSGPTTTERVL